LLLRLLHFQSQKDYPGKAGKKPMHMPWLFLSPKKIKLRLTLVKYYIYLLSLKIQMFKHIKEVGIVWKA
jgi:hypothetical protein